MTETKPILEFTVDRADASTPVIVVAAGNSTRMQGVNKQLTCIFGIPLIIRTLQVFEQSKYISNIILVVRTEDVFEMQMMVEKYGIKKVSDIICGGETRQESVKKGLSRVKNSKGVLIHDGARPLVDDLIIGAVSKALETNPAVTCGVKLKDTVKKIREDGSVVETLPRDRLISVQTPQGVWVKEYLEVLEKLDNIGSFTDDTSIMESAGYTVMTVPGSYKNIKITTPEDISVAEGFLREE